MTPRESGPSLARHVPLIALDWIRTSPEQTWRSIDGSLCFADISGFTALTERLGAHGRIGAEELVETLNGIFGSMLGVAAGYGGQLLKFGGDALLLHYDGPDHAVRAASAAVEMRRALRESWGTSTAVGRLQLSMSVGIASGDIDFLLIGAPHRELVPIGPVVTQTLSMESAADAGQIFLGPGTAERLPASAVRMVDRVRALRWRHAPIAPAAVGGPGPDERLDGAALDDDAAALLPSQLVAALGDVPDPSHRFATMAFIGLSGLDAFFTDGPQSAAAAADDALQAIQRALADEDITLLASDPAPDGFKLMCAAGAPSASEDDEGRMLRALRRIVTARLPLAVQAGVNRGPVFAAEVGTDWRAAYSAMGDTTNTAARVMAKTPPGHVYAHPTVLEHARTLYASEPVGHFAMKGKAEPILLYDVGRRMGARPDIGRETLPLVGRAAEIAALQEPLDSLAAGRGGLVTVFGPPAVGKSRLVREALQGRTSDVSSLLMRAEPYGAASPYRPFRDPLRSILGITRDSDDVMAATLSIAVARIDPAFAPYAPLLAQVVHVDLPSNPTTDAIGSEHRADRTADLVIQALATKHTGGLVIVMDDAQWCDESSSHLLGRLELETSSRPWLLVVIRRESLDGFLPRTGAEIALRPLDPGSMRELVIAATQAAPLRPHEVDTIVDRAAGSPAYVEEWTRAARAVGTLDSVPATLHAAITTQLDALRPMARRAIAYASVLGRSFRVDLLADLLAREGRALDDATHSELGVFLEDDDGDRMRFRNGLVSDVAYDGMAYRTRSRLHRAAGEALERMTGGVGSDVDMLSYHFWRAGHHERTWRYSVRAAERARQAAANADAATLLERALGAARWLESVEDDERLEQWLALGELRDRAGMLDTALDAYRAAAGFLRDGDAIGRAELYLRRATTHERAGAYPIALREATRARSILNGVQGHRPAVLRADALAFASFVRQRQEHAVTARALAEQAAAEADQAGAVAARARATNVISWAATMLGEPDAARWARQALALYEEAGDLAGQADMANNLGVQAYFAGRWDETLVLYQRSRDAFRRIGSVIDVAGADANIGEVLVNQGRLDEAETVLREAERVLRASGHRSLDAFAAMHLGRILMVRGHLSAAESELRRVLEQELAHGRTASAYETCVHLADCLDRLGRAEEALELLSHAARLTTEDVSVFDPARDRITATALRSAGRVEEATRRLERGIRAARSRGLEYELSLMLADAADWPLPVHTGNGEPAATESARLFARLGVVAVGQRPRHFQNGSPAPS